jgi:ribosomal protein L7/L12
VVWLWIALAVVLLLLFLGLRRALTPAVPAPPRVVQPLSPDLALEVQGYLARGVKIEAIRVVRARTGMGLRDAKDAVEAIEQGGPIPGAGPSPEPAPASTAAGLDWDALVEVARMRDQGQAIQAIKRVRELTGMGLREAKDLVEGLPPAPPAT